MKPSLTVNIDQQRGSEHVRRMVAQLRPMVHLPRPPATKEQIAQLERRQSQAIYVEIADTTSPRLAGLTTCLIPEEPVFFGYSSVGHQDATKPLLARCATALGYEIEGE